MSRRVLALVDRALADRVRVLPESLQPDAHAAPPTGAWPASRSRSTDEVRDRGSRAASPHAVRSGGRGTRGRSRRTPASRSRPASVAAVEDRVLPAVAGRRRVRRRRRRRGRRGTAAAASSRSAAASGSASRRTTWSARSGAYDASHAAGRVDPLVEDLRLALVERAPLLRLDPLRDVDVRDLEEQREVARTPAGTAQPRPRRRHPGRAASTGTCSRSRARSRRGPPCRPWRPRSGRTRRRAAGRRRSRSDRSRPRGSASGGGRRSGAARA